MHRVAIYHDVYSNFQSYMDWLVDDSFYDDYGVYLTANQSPELEYVKSVSVDQVHTTMPYEVTCGNNMRDDGTYERFRIFEFESEAHYHWFLLRWG